MLFDFIVDFIYGVTHRKEIKRMKQSLEEANKPENRNKPRVYHGRNLGYFWLSFIKNTLIILLLSHFPILIIAFIIAVIAVISPPNTPIKLEILDIVFFKFVAVWFSSCKKSLTVFFIFKNTDKIPPTHT